MKRKYIVNYFFGFLTAITVIIIFFCYLKHYLRTHIYIYIPPEREAFLTDEHWINTFSKYREEFKIVEDFYNSIETWEFVSVHYKAERMGRKIVYYVRDSYSGNSFVVGEKFPICDFLQVTMTSRDFSKNGCVIVILGDRMEEYEIYDKPFSYERRLIIKLYHSDYTFSGYIYSPNESLTINCEEWKEYEVKFLGEGWYYLKQCIDPSELCF